ncbi:hypothetical protein DOK76_02325 [Vagococcus sp. DIV0080]|uniref:Prepilin-type N-terminal cleavage/methylation domain-containing protein n=1 Tax=Candidatus Vagococcus giribetii TaxID=2230876 RepID=A0ABS3HQ71_9ENTE|nr:hypothetical protein [Vagococcus sp. DIV0080]MBO0475889.1 hypothetical protein [Vagococcus sp. DIV0080]
MMKRIISNEEGITLVELVAGLALLGLILIPLGTLLSFAGDSVKLQREQADIQSTANLMVAQMIAISQKEGLYEQAGYSDYGTPAWEQKHIVKVNGSGTNKVEVTDILDKDNQRKKTYQIKNPKVSIHVDQKKNIHDNRKNNQLLSNSRDTFTIQESVEITFKKEGKEVFSQQVELDYRDEKKAVGEIGGEGYW